MSQHEVLGEKASETKPCFVVIHGLHTSCKAILDYVEHIVYGTPRIEAVEVGSHFVAICEFPAGQWNWAKGTFERMGSFPHGAALSFDKEVAIREFGAWVYHHAPGRFLGIVGYCEDASCPSYGEPLVNGICPAAIA